MQTMGNLRNMKNIGMDELMEEGRYSAAVAQVQLPREALEQATQIALASLRKVPGGKPEHSFVALWQGSQEPYTDFLDLLQNVIVQQVESEEAKQLITSHATRS